VVWAGGVWLSDGMVVGPGLFEAMGELLHGLGALRTPDDDADCGGTDAGDHPEKVFHVGRLLVRMLRFMASAGADVGLMQRIHSWMGEGDGLHWEYGFGAVWTRAGCGSPPGREDGGVGCGCCHGSKPFRENSRRWDGHGPDGGDDSASQGTDPADGTWSETGWKAFW
jgi:hypothetical protein